jgi:hypothetical protein
MQLNKRLSAIEILYLQRTWICQSRSFHLNELLCDSCTPPPPASCFLFRFIKSVITMVLTVQKEIIVGLVGFNDRPIMKVGLLTEVYCLSSGVVTVSRACCGVHHGRSTSWSLSPENGSRTGSVNVVHYPMDGSPKEVLLKAMHHH